MGKKIEIDRSLLEELYVNQKLKIKEISEQLNCGRNTITRKLQEYGFKEGTSYKPQKEKVDPLLETKEKIKELYLSGMTCAEVGKVVNLSEKTVGYHLKNLGVEKRPQKKIDQDTFERLWAEGKTDEEIAAFFNVCLTTIKSFRTRGENAGKFNQTRYFSQEEHTLSEEQEQFILGSLLGDLNLSAPGNTKRCVNSRLTVVHSIKQKELFMKKVELLGEFMASWKLYTPTPDKRTGKVYQTYRGNSYTHKVFTDIWHLVYPNGKKVITLEYLERIHSPLALAYWFMDDGCYQGTIATNCFSEAEIDLLIKWMNDKWSIKCSKQQNIQNGNIQYVLHIDKESRFDFEKLIFPYIIPSMYYKLKYLEKLK